MIRFLLILFLSMQVFSQHGPISVEISEEDGSPSTYPYKVLFANGTLTDNGDGTTSVAGGGGGAAGALHENLSVQAAKITGSYITAGAGISAGNPTWELLFDASTTESAIWQFRVPASYASTPIAVLQYSMASATSGDIDLEVEVMSVADGETPDTASFDSVNEVTGGTTVPGTAGLLDTISIPLTNNDSMVAGELVIIRINRDHDDADDDATGDLELKSIQITWS